MKAKYLLMSLMLLVLAACQDESLIENKPPKGIKVYATTNNNDATRLTFTEGDGVTYATWKGGDGIGLFSETQSNLQYRAPFPTESKKEFTSRNGELLNAKEGETIYAYYPYHSNPPIEEGLQVRCNVYSECWYEGSRVGANPFMYASGVVNNGQVSLQFKHLYAYIKLTLTPEFIKKTSDDTSIKRISLNSTEDISLYNGVFDLEKQEIVSDESKRKYKNFSFVDSECPDVSSSAFVIYLQVLPQTENALVKINVTTKENGDVCSISRKAPKGGLKAGHVYSLNAEKEEIGSTEDEMREALIEFYKATNGDNWNNNTNWCSDKPITEWYGISMYKLYYEMNLSDNNLSGNLEECLKPLYGLPIRLLEVDHNNIYGTIPKEIDQMPYLTNLFLDSTGISGEIPDEIGNLSQLYQLSLQFTQISGNIPESIGRLKNLTWLHLSNTNLSGTIPNSICDLKNLLILEIGHNTIGGLSGKIPQNIGNLDNLYTLDLRNNQLTGNLPVSMSKLQNCKELNLSGNKLSGHIPSEVFNQPLFTSWIRNFMNQQDGYILTYDETYKSTDFSKDKEVTVLQKHTKGNGIPLIIMGDIFVDKDMEAGGLYETAAKNAMEGYFSKEPTKSLREYFDVYCVKAVSTDEYMGGNTAFATYTDDHLVLGGDFGIVEEYAHCVRKNLSDTNILVLLNTAGVNMAICYMVTNGCSISYVGMGGGENSNTILHESVGHGLAHLGDEYVGHIYPPMNEEEKQTFRTSQKELGWYLNLDLTNDLNYILWSRFVKDERYKNENIGAYEGGFEFYKTGIWRPTELSIMRTTSSNEEFSAPHRELIYKRVMELAYGDSWTYDYETFVEWDLAHKPATRGIAIPQTSDKQSTIKHLPPVILDYPSSEIGKHKDIIVPLR